MRASNSMKALGLQPELPDPLKYDTKEESSVQVRSFKQSQRIHAWTDRGSNTTLGD